LIVIVYAIPVIITEYTTSYTEMSYLVNRLGIVFCALKTKTPVDSYLIQL